MIKQDARLSIRRIPIGCILVEESRPRYLSMVQMYVQQMHDNPHDDAGLMRVKPSKAHPGLYVLDDGHHRLCASIIVGRQDVLCVVIEE